jgi:hypothetical protein
MIPTIQVVYGSMPILDYENKLIKYDREFYLFADIYNIDVFGQKIDYACTIGEIEIINEFLNKCFDFEDYDLHYSNHNALYLYHKEYDWFYLNDLSNINHELSVVFHSIINTLLSDEFYDAFQIFVGEFKLSFR